MELQDAIRRLQSNGERIRALARAVTPDEARWKPSPEEWSILEVVNHLYDEEREDFRVKLDIILHRPEEKWPPIDPQGWVTDRAYNERELVPSLAAFLEERAASLAWLAGLKDADWDTTYPAPWGSPIRAGDMLAAWVAHDVLHLRQLVEVQWALTERALAPYLTRYAGEW